MFSQFVCSVWQNWGKESEGGWVTLSRRALSFETNHAFELLVQKRLEFELVAHKILKWFAVLGVRILAVWVYQ